MKVGVIAGTPVDTTMGIEYIKSKGHNAIGRYCSETPIEQTQMQILHKHDLGLLVIRLCNEMIIEGAEGIFLNCNSLSGAIELDMIRKEVLVRIVTPLDIYEECASNYKCLSIIAANCQSLAAIEKVILKINPRCIVYGAAILPLVMEIESGKPSQLIYKELNIKALAEHLSALKCEAFILGCTHFPFIMEQLKKDISVPIINPSDKMLELLNIL